MFVRFALFFLFVSHYSTLVTGCEGEWDICAGCGNANSGENVGTVTVTAEEVDNGMEYTVVVRTAEGFSFEELHLWHGGCGEDDPSYPSRGRGANPAFGQFPVHYEGEEETFFSYTFLVEDAECDNCVKLIVHLAMSDGETAIAGRGPGDELPENAEKFCDNGRCRWGWVLTYEQPDECCDPEGDCPCSADGIMCAGCSGDDAGYDAGTFSLAADEDGNLLVTLTADSCFLEVHIWTGESGPPETNAPGQFPHHFTYDCALESNTFIIPANELPNGDACTPFAIAIHAEVIDGETAWGDIPGEWNPLPGPRWGWWGDWCTEGVDESGQEAGELSRRNVFNITQS